MHEEVVDVRVGFSRGLEKHYTDRCVSKLAWISPSSGAPELVWNGTRMVNIEFGKVNIDNGKRREAARSTTYEKSCSGENENFRTRGMQIAERQPYTCSPPHTV